ncbi:hypothetical protein Bca52824_017339 [Brassica carinata]|uniref:Uncharacterized protein n=1 Tax=Brassica carinata TaxID=52824 RepID=A0A8X8AY71_BRACI|nr:hypothetical protein Bca52824_017339 [Brassica carinata]
MGCIFRLWRGVWKKNKRLHWHFVPTPADYGFTMFMDSPQTFDRVEAAVREHYVLGEFSPVVITYRMPDWMIFPSGQVPPVTITNTAELLSVMNRRPPMSDVTLLLTLGAKNVAEYQFLCRSDFTIRSTTYVVGENQDERAKATYESLVFGERLLTCEEVMKEIFGEREMVILHRVALEMGSADKAPRPQPGGRNVTGMEIIQLDDDDDMVVVEGVVVPFQKQPLPQISASAAPSVLWDVGLDLLEYPEFFNAQRDGILVSMEDFANGTMDDSCNFCDKAFVVGTGPDDYSRAAIFEEETDSSAGSTQVVCSQVMSGFPMETNEGDLITHGGGVVETDKMKGTTGTSSGAQSSGLSLTLACGNAEG